MAKSTKSQSKSIERNKKSNGEENEKGWETVTADRAPWLVKQPGLVVTGILLGRFSFGSGRDKRFYFQLKLTCGGVDCVSGSGDEQKETTLNRGDIVSVGESFALQRDLAPLTDDGGKYEVKLSYGEPERDKTGKAKFWPVVTSKRTISPPTRKPRIEEVESNSRDDEPDRSGDDSDVPF